MLKQRLLGLVAIAIGIAVIAMASQGTTVEERDATPALMILPLGIYAFITKRNIIDDPECEIEDKYIQDKAEAAAAVKLEKKMKRA